MAHVSNTPKAVREALCAAQSGLSLMPQALGVSAGQAQIWIDQLGELIAEIDMIHRPISSDGTHGSWHTNTCGCDGHRKTWSIVLDPGMTDYD